MAGAFKTGSVKEVAYNLQTNVEKTTIEKTKTGTVKELVNHFSSVRIFNQIKSPSIGYPIKGSVKEKAHYWIQMSKSSSSMPYRELSVYWSDKSLKDRSMATGSVKQKALTWTSKTKKDNKSSSKSKATGELSHYWSAVDKNGKHT